jgi:hypothetical protein
MQLLGTSSAKQNFSAFYAETVESINIHKRDLDDMERLYDYVELDIPVADEKPEQKHAVVPYYLSPDPNGSVLFQLSFTFETKISIVTIFLLFLGYVVGDIITSHQVDLGVMFLPNIMVNLILKDYSSRSERIPDINEQNLNKVAKRTILTFLAFLFIFANLDSPFMAGIATKLSKSRQYKISCENYEIELIGDNTMDFKLGNQKIGQFHCEIFMPNMIQISFKSDDTTFKKLNPNGISEISFSVEPNGPVIISCSSYDANSKICQDIEMLARESFLAELSMKAIADYEYIYPSELYKLANPINNIQNSKISEHQSNKQFKVCSHRFEDAIITAAMVKFRRHSLQCLGCISKCETAIKSACEGRSRCRKYFPCTRN